MAWAIMGGLLVATLLTLLFLPALYASWYRAKRPNEGAIGARTRHNVFTTPAMSPSAVRRPLDDPQRHQLSKRQTDFPMISVRRIEVRSTKMITAAQRHPFPLHCFNRRLAAGRERSTQSRTPLQLLSGLCERLTASTRCM